MTHLKHLFPVLICFTFLASCRSPADAVAGEPASETPASDALADGGQSDSMLLQQIRQKTVAYVSWKDRVLFVSPDYLAAVAKIYNVDDLYSGQWTLKSPQGKPVQVSVIKTDPRDLFERFLPTSDDDFFLKGLQCTDAPAINDPCEPSGNLFKRGIVPPFFGCDVAQDDDVCGPARIQDIGDTIFYNTLDDCRRDRNRVQTIRNQGVLVCAV